MSALAAAVATRDTVDLAELDERAALLTRVDRKYVLARSEAARVLDALDGRFRVLEVDGERWSRYESVYFDTPELASYLATARRRRRRFKVRARTYLDSGDCYLEVKTRGGRGVTVKERRPRVAGSPGRFEADDGEYAAHVLGSAAVPPVDTTRLEPTLEVTYRRATLLLPGLDGTPSRATIDLGLRWALPGSVTELLGLPGLAVLETKTTGHASELDRLLWAHGHRPSSISKYGTGLAALHPGLPATRWHRTLHRHIAPNA